MLKRCRNDNTHDLAKRRRSHPRLPSTMASLITSRVADPGGTGTVEKTLFHLGIAPLYLIPSVQPRHLFGEGLDGLAGHCAQAKRHPNRSRRTRKVRVGVLMQLTLVAGKAN